MQKKATESIRIYRKELACLDRLKAEMRARGEKPSYADLMEVILGNDQRSTNAKPLSRPAENANPNHALLDLALSSSSHEQQRAIVAWLQGKAGIIPEENHEAETAKIRTEPASNAREKASQAKRSKATG
jgi:hypothetical protein